MSYEIIKLNYTKGLWSKEMVSLAVEKGIISQKQYNEIINEKKE